MKIEIAAQNLGKKLQGKPWFKGTSHGVKQSAWTYLVAFYSGEDPAHDSKTGMLKPPFDEVPQTYQGYTIYLVKAPS